MSVIAETVPLPAASISPTTQIVTSAARSIEVTDERGRTIVTRKWSLFEELSLIEGLGACANNQAYLLRALYIASVVSIAGVAETPVRTKEQLLALAGRLDSDGLEAVVDGHNKHFKKGESGDPLK